MFSPSGVELSLLMSYFADILRCWDVWAKGFMLTFVSEGVVDGGFRLVPLAVLGADFMLLSEVYNSTCWKFDGFEGGGAYVAIFFWW